MIIRLDKKIASYPDPVQKVSMCPTTQRSRGSEHKAREREKKKKKGHRRDTQLCYFSFLQCEKTIMDSTPSSPSKSRLVTLKVPSNILQKYVTTPSTPTTTSASTPTKTATTNPPVKERAKPGPKPKKKPTTNIPSSPAGPDDQGSGPTTAAGHSKPGPKGGANVNANLRALDRTGAPTRRWKIQPVELKSFTGHKFTLNAWASKKTEQEELEDQRKKQLEENSTSAAPKEETPTIAAGSEPPDQEEIKVEN